MVRRRGEAQRQRRFLLRLATAVATLLRLRLGLPQDPELLHSLPLTPSTAVQLLDVFARGASVEDLLAIAEQQ